ncbi:hypothetical protein KO528_15720 [Saccharophagus degradans]|uniref:Uncharacterized protein n=1 Tax=Saccharophagus degradans TaxID=86304 RepID=A0AAW7XAY9_9GAMM|nr:hypothetical protein [Saccharophagus degradans]MBU2986813.1 hypothetical protein [Saccharophagus degradans]MDO6424832.1 hypothetical protein [Saccharophagus degradans]MDO6606620.1 hypothetical protein [Saccharophagus degradans]
MKTFKDVFIRVGDAGIVDYIENVTNELKKPWTRAYINEESSKYLGEVAFCFQREGDSTLPTAGLSIFQKDGNSWYIPNVVPIEAGQLSYEEYNEIITDFYESCLMPVSAQHGIAVEISTGELKDEEIVGETPAKLLKAFSNCANKSTGSAHPSDRNRWLEFIVAACTSKNDIDTGDLKRLLQQQGWSEEFSLDLVIEFEFGRDLIKHMEA